MLMKIPRTVAKRSNSFHVRDGLKHLEEEKNYILVYKL